MARMQQRHRAHDRTASAHPSRGSCPACRHGRCRAIRTRPRRSRARPLSTGRAHGAARSAFPPGRSRAGHAVDLAVGRGRNTVHHHPVRRHHVVGQLLAQVRTQLRAIDFRACAGHEVGGQHGLTGAAARQCDHRLGDIGVTRQRGIDLAGLDAVAAQLPARPAGPGAGAGRRRASGRDRRSGTCVHRPGRLPRRSVRRSSSGRAWYPVATPSPAITISPVAPIGIGSPSGDRIWMRVLPIGCPMTMSPSPGVMCAQVDQTVVSVGPYIFQSSPTRDSRASASSVGSASPPHSAFHCGPPRQPASSNKRHVDGVACRVSILCSSSRARRRTPSLASSRSTSSISAPHSKGSRSSSTAMSNDSVVTAASRDSSDSAGRCCIDSRKFNTARRGTTTPFGTPVEPEV